jgi:hypothetical protein
LAETRSVLHGVGEPMLVKELPRTLGNATQQTMREIWNGEKYQDFAARC